MCSVVSKTHFQDMKVAPVQNKKNSLSVWTLALLPRQYCNSLWFRCALRQALELFISSIWFLKMIWVCLKIGCSNIPPFVSPHQSCHENPYFCRVISVWCTHKSQRVASAGTLLKIKPSDTRPWPIFSSNPDMVGWTHHPLRIDPECHILPLHHQTSPCPGIEARH